MNPTVKALLHLTAIGLIVMPINAAPVDRCAPIVQNINDLSAGITRQTNSYWAYRKNFVNLKSKALHNDPNADRLADREKHLADPVRAAMPNAIKIFHSILDNARANNCLSPNQLKTLKERATSFARSINFDKFPSDEKEELSATPTRMPRS